MRRKDNSEEHSNRLDGLVGGDGAAADAVVCVLLCVVCNTFFNVMSMATAEEAIPCFSRCISNFRLFSFDFGQPLIHRTIVFV